MTYRELFEALKTFSEKQLDMDVAIYISKTDQLDTCAAGELQFTQDVDPNDPTDASVPYFVTGL